VGEGRVVGGAARALADVGDVVAEAAGGGAGEVEAGGAGLDGGRPAGAVEEVGVVRGDGRLDGGQLVLEEEAEGLLIVLQEEGVAGSGIGVVVAVVVPLGAAALRCGGWWVGWVPMHLTL
jgi:hypothetical protein